MKGKHTGGSRAVSSKGQHAAGRANRKRTRKSRKAKALIVIAAVFAIFAVAIVLLYNRWVVKPQLPNREPADGGQQSGQTGEQETDIDAVAPMVTGSRKSEDFYTVLIVGADESSNQTDTIMVVSYDVTNQKASVMSIPRDTLVNVRWNPKKINSVYSVNGSGEEGLEALITQVSNIIGFRPDYHIVIDWELVGQMVNAIGGVHFDVPYDMDYDDDAQDLHIHLSKGYQELNGEDAMDLVRWRKNNSGVALGDVQRLDIQHDFLAAVLQETLQIKNVTKIGELVSLFQENTESDLIVENLFWFASQAVFGGLKVEDVEFTTMPYATGYDYTGRFSYVYPIQSELMDIINNGLNPYAADVTYANVDWMSINADGTLSSTTGVLRDPDMGYIPAQPEPEPEPEEPEPPAEEPQEPETPPEEPQEPETPPEEPQEPETPPEEPQEPEMPPEEPETPAEETDPSTGEEAPL